MGEVDEVDVTVLICTRNRAADLGATLAACARVAVPAGLEVELLVVDNASQDETAGVVAAADTGPLRLRLAREERVGKSRALNRGIAEAAGRVILFADDDAHPPREWIERVAGPVLAGDADLAGGGLTLAPGLRRPWMSPMHLAWLSDNLGTNGTSLRFLVGANLAVRRDLVRELGGFDPRLGPGPEGLGNAEDTLLAYRAQRAGARIVHAPEATLIHHLHPDRLTRDWFLKASVARGRSDAYVAHHFTHDAPARLAPARLRAGLRLALERLKPHPADYATDDEMWLLKQAAFYDQLALERRLPPRYA